MVQIKHEYKSHLLTHSSSNILATDDSVGNPAAWFLKLPSSVFLPSINFEFWILATSEK